MIRLFGGGNNNTYWRSGNNDYWTGTFTAQHVTFGRQSANFLLDGTATLSVDDGLSLVYSQENVTSNINSKGISYNGLGKKIHLPPPGPPH
jgi:hypothetical protein